MPPSFEDASSAAELAVHPSQEFDTVLVCRVDAGNGRLKPSDLFAQVRSPACVKFFPLADGRKRP